MSYYSKSKSELAKIGADAFTLLDDSSYGHKYKPKPSSSTISTSPVQPIDKLFHYQYQREQAYVVRQQVYVAPIHATRTETVVDCHEAAKRYGGTVIVDYPKRKPARRGFFF
ncbi:hypothetical protein OSB04_010924 [Centaurea solstitialis]|uniref:Uncharacterized protein n=1 Tax=Centaurea solstitialis TaxID=347529 RepID=A0AA38WL24_9ASTR|nr:hypothetical protein OSB04_010924 [Centaurea solstitialis]